MKRRHTRSMELPARPVSDLTTTAQPEQAQPLRACWAWILAATGVAAVIACGGCQSLAAGPFGGAALASDSPIGEGAEDPSQPSASSESEPRAESAVAQAGGSSWADSTRRSTTRLVNFVTGQKPEDKDRGKKLYQEGDTAFRQAQSLSRGEAAEEFAEAAELFRQAGETAPGTALEQDALFMEAESRFFADDLTEAADLYQRLQKEFPRSRHNDRVAARLFAISQYWIDTEKATDDQWFTLNLTDKTRPALDVDGHAIRVLDQIRYDDPTGRLADDATMAAAAEYIRQEKFDMADEFLTDLRQTFTDSDHLFLAHMLGIRCKLEVYAGPKYSNLLLEEADELVEQTRQRFPNKLQGTKYGDMVARAAAEIAYHKAEKLFVRAEYREKRSEYRAARTYYRKILERYGETPFAETARRRLEVIEEKPATVERRLSWMTTIFPSSDRSEPLKLKTGGESKLR